MSFPRYESYKDSDLHWLGEIPSHWNIMQSRRLFALRKDKATENDRQLTASQKHGVLYQDDYTALEGQKVVQVITGAEILKHVEPNDFVISMRSFQGGIEWCGYRGSISSAYVMLIPSDAINVRFFSYLFKCKPYIQALQSTSNLVRDGQALRYENFTLINLPVIPYTEQQTIAAFLDRETAKIDALMAEQQWLIELLKEKRQAVISHAVTKGLNPDAPMKDSGIEWLGEVPEHWEVVSIKWLSPVLRGASPRPIDDQKYFDDDGEYSWVRIADVSASDGILRETTQKLSDLGSSLSVKIEPGSIFVSIAGTVGKPCISAIKACIHDGFVYFPKLEINPQFLYRIFESGTCYAGLGKWGTQLNLNTDTIGSIRVALPPQEELNHVLTFLDRETAKIDAFTAEAQTAIALLQERRTALISAAVTGKIDVRGLVATQPEREAAA